MRPQAVRDNDVESGAHEVEGKATDDVGVADRRRTVTDNCIEIVSGRSCCHGSFVKREESCAMAATKSDKRKARRFL